MATKTIAKRKYGPEQEVDLEEDEEGRRRARAPASLEPRMVKCFVEEDGVSFTAEVQSSRRTLQRIGEDGVPRLYVQAVEGSERIVRIHDLVHPEPPPELRVNATDGVSKTVEYQAWYWEIYKGVLRRYVGKPLPKSIIVPEAAPAKATKS